MPAPLYVVYRTLPSLDASAIARRLGKDSWATADATTLAIQHAGHTLRAVAVDSPVPAAEMTRCLPVAHLRADMKAELASHTAHIALMHPSSEPGIDGLIALYQVAAALGGEPLGVINPITCMCITGAMLRDSVTPEFVAKLRAQPEAAMVLWLGFIKLFKPDGGAWLTTAGWPMLELPNLAMLVPTLADVNDAFDLMVAVLGYLYAQRGKRTILPGDTLDFGGTNLRAREPYEYVAQIGAQTLVIEKVAAA